MARASAWGLRPDRELGVDNTITDAALREDGNV
jgi:hypothetical protein